MSTENRLDHEPSIVRHTLKNGTIVLVQEDHSTPVVSLNFWVEAGSVDEQPDERGMAHLIEHMIFKGTPSRGVGEISRQVEAAGGYLNAFTSYEHTCFYVVLPSSQIQKALEIQFDAYLHSTFDAGELEKEKEVVFEEMRMRQDDPWSWSWELLLKLVYQRNPYHWPVIGDREILRGVPRDRLVQYYRKHYVPSNTVISVVGDIREKDVLQWIQDRSEAAPSTPHPIRRFEADGEPTALRFHAEAGDVQQSYLSIGFPTVPQDHPDAPALEILESVLGDGASSRLNLALREKSQTANEVGCENFSGKYGGVLVFQAVTDRERLEKCAFEMMAEVKKIILAGAHENELAKVKNKIKAAKLFEKQNMDGQAKTLGFWELQGGYQLEGLFMEKLGSVTSEDLRRVAEKYVLPHRASIVLYHPKAQAPSLDAVSWTEALQRGLDAPMPSKGKGKTTAGEKIARFRLSNGSTLLVKRRAQLPLTSIGGFIPGGFSFERPTQYGLTALMTKCLMKGTRRRDHEAFAKEVESLAAHLDPVMEKDYWGLSLDVTKPHFEKAFGLMLESLLEPDFSRQEVRKEKRLQIDHILRLKDDPAEYALAQSDVLTFKGTPYAHMPIGTVKTVSALSNDHVKKWHGSLLRGHAMTWVAVGDYDPADLKSYLESKLSEMRPGRTTRTRPVWPRGPEKDSFYLRTEGQQANIVLGFKAAPFRSPEYFPFRVLNTVLNGMGGKLFVELREKRSLAYSVFAAHDAGISAGIYQIYIGCAPDKADAAKKGLLDVLAEFSDTVVSEAELERAKTYMIGLYQMGLQSNRSQVHSYARYELMGQGAAMVEQFPEKVRKINAKDIQLLARKYFKKTAPTWVLITPTGRDA